MSRYDPLDTSSDRQSNDSKTENREAEILKRLEFLYSKLGNVRSGEDDNGAIACLRSAKVSEHKRLIIVSRQLPFELKKESSDWRGEVLDPKGNEALSNYGIVHSTIHMSEKEPYSCLLS